MTTTTETRRGAYPAHLDATERRIISRLLHDAIAAGCTVSVFDGEEWPVLRSRNLAAIRPEIAATEATELVIRDAQGARVAWVWLIHGNGCDVISDCTDTPEARRLLAGAEALAESLDR